MGLAPHVQWRDRAGFGCRPPIKAHLRRYGALGRTLNVQKVRLACGSRAPPRSWTFLSRRRVGAFPERGDVMKITGIESVVLNIPTRKPMALELPEHRMVVATIATDEGVTGLGYSLAFGGG